MSTRKLPRATSRRILDWRDAHRAWRDHHRTCAAIGIPTTQPRALWCEVWVGWMIADHRARHGAPPEHWV